MNIDKDLFNLLLDTKPNQDNLKIKYPAMFINHQFKINEKYIINGMLIVDMDDLEKVYNIKSMNAIHNDKRKNVLSLCIDLEHKYEFFNIVPLDILDNELKSMFIGDNKAESQSMFKAAKLIKKIAINTINIIANDEKNIEYVDVKYSNEQKQKRITKGKLPLKDHTVLRLSGVLKKYITEYNFYRKQGSITARYFVSGHWRRFFSEFYKQKQGTKVWIYPYYRGMDNLPERIIRFVEVKK
jgi:hypothetical protein